MADPAAMAKASTARERYADRKSRGTCVHSGCDATPVSGRARCQRHLDAVAAAKRKHEQPRPRARVVATPGVVAGLPRLDGTRLTVASMLGVLDCPAAFGLVREMYPHMSDEQIRVAFRFAIESVNNRRAHRG